jgi:ubiquinone biosynthesis protein
MRVRTLWRLVVIERTLTRHGLDEFVWRTHLLRPVAWLRRLRFWRRSPKEPMAVRLRLAIEELGPIFVKFGQAVSVRRDLLPNDIANELAKLQDQVPPFASEQAIAAIEKAFGKPVDTIYAYFERPPLAAASIAQVHAAQLRSGQSVVVKLLRPKAREMIARDLEILYLLAELAEQYWPGAERLHPVDVVREFDNTLQNELDLMREAANATQLRRNFADSDLLYVPEVHWDYCRTNVMTMERIDGIPISAIDELRRADVDIKKLAENGVEIFFTQVFKHNFFHADMHPGNIFVDARDPKNPRYIAIDFGIVGTLSAQDQHYLAENFLAFFRRDYHRVAKLHVDSGWVPLDTRVDELESAIRAVCEPIFDKPLKDISFGIVLLRLFATAQQFHMEVQPQLVLLQKTLLAIEGLGRQLYPELDLWKTAYPVLEHWVRQRRDPLVLVKRLLKAWPEVSEDLMQLPQIMRRQLYAASGQQLGKESKRTRRRERSVADYWPASMLMLAGVLWIGFAISPRELGWIAASIGLVWLMWLVARKP